MEAEERISMVSNHDLAIHVENGNQTITMKDITG
jgi:hypothetical protein